MTQRPRLRPQDARPRLRRHDSMAASAARMMRVMGWKPVRAETRLRLRALARQPARAPSRGDAQRPQILTLRSVNYKQ
jgi:hypothetical protein